MRRGRIRLAAGCGALLALALVAPLSAAEARIMSDGQGRSIRFDVRAPGADVAGYAAVLRAAVHGEEIARVTIRVVAPSALHRACSFRSSAGCFSRSGGRSVVTIPARPAAQVRAILLHEYAHHLDWEIANRPSGVREPNGTPRWWAARAMGARLRSGQVALGYARGWARSVGEIFAEDYVQLHGSAHYGIRWLGRPGPRVLQALRADILGRPGARPARTPPRPVRPAPPPARPPAPPVAPSPSPRLLTAGGVLLGRGRHTVSFTVAQGAEVRLEGRLDGAGGPAGGPLTLSCEGRRIGGTWVGEGMPASFGRRALPAGRCEATLENAAPVPASFRMAVHITAP